MLLEALVTCAVVQGVARPDSALPPGRLQGSVIAAQTSAPIEGAAVSISPAGGGVMAAGRSSPFWELTRTTRTDANGTYRFNDLAPGLYQLHIQRIGYQSTDVEVDLRDAAALRLSVGLSMLPIALEPVIVRAIAAAGPSSFRGRWEEVARSRLNAETERRRRFLATDTRALTTADLTEAVTLGETDLFRALQRFAGVTTRDEFTAELWTRGGRWSDTRVTYDGLPLFSPLHAGGTIAGVPPDVVGTAVFHPGVRPAASGEGAAAALELTSRPARDAGFHGVAELSTVSARTTFEGGDSGATPRWVIGARRSVIDLVTNLLSDLKQDSTIPIPYAFRDLAARLDIPVSQSSVLELSGLWSEDVLAGGVRNLLTGSRGTWGNALVRATLVAPLGSMTSRHTIGVSRYRMRGAPCPNESCSLGSPVMSYLETRSDLTYLVFGGLLVPRGGDTWAAGYQFASQRLRYEGRAPIPYPGEAASTHPPFGAITDVVALWGERRARIGERLKLQGGLRVETGTRIRNQSSVRLGPRLQARYTAGDGVALSAGFGRSFQYSQTIGPLGPSFGPDLHLSDVWILAGDTMPAIQSDILGGGIEYWMSGEWVAAFNVYWREERGIAVPDPTPGFRLPITHESRLFVVGSKTSRGSEVSLRKLSGRLTGSVSLGVSGSQISAIGYNYPAPNHRHVVLHATGLLAMNKNLRVGGAATVAGKAPFTRYVDHTACDGPEGPVCPASGAVTPSIEAPGEARARAVATLDLLADWDRSYRGWTLGAYVQLRNVLRATRAVSYTRSLDRCVAAGVPERVQVRPGVCDEYARGLPLLPLAGVRVSF